MSISGWVKAQSGYNYSPFGIGIGYSSVKAYADLKKQNTHQAYNINAYYNYSPYLPVAAELQFGTLSGGSNSDRKIDASGRQYTNAYKALILHADVMAGEILNYDDSFFKNLIKNFYIGTGFGLIYNNMTFIQRKDLYNPAYGSFPGSDKGLNVMIPLRFGYEIKFFNSYDEPVFAIDLGYRHNVTLGEGLDGYDDPPQIFKNNSFDQYRQITVGIKVNFGAPVAYNKNIRRGF
ncbi:hypothetical protein GCM10027037_30830 [Mucilaginibacter koreensis]